MAVVGMWVRTPEVFNNASFMVIFPLSFVANTFVDPSSMPPVLRTIAEWNPLSALTQAVRNLFGNTNPMVPPPDVWPLQNPILASLLWTALILIVFVPLAIYRYQKAVSR
jgi:ABC-type multidrug transport system permease subunit